MLKIRSFLRLIKDSIRNFAIKMIKRYNRHMAATAYALSAIILVFYFGNLAGFKVNPNEVKADAATYTETDRYIEGTKSSEIFNSDINEYALNSPDHKILLDLTTETKDMTPKQEKEVFSKIYPLGQLSISPAVIHYNDVITSMAILTALQSQYLAKNTLQMQTELYGMQMHDEEVAIDIASLDKEKNSVLTVNPAQENAIPVTTETNKNYKDTTTKDSKTENKKTEEKKTTEKKNQEKKPQAEETLAKTDKSVPASLKLATNKKMIKTLSKDELNVLCRIVEAEATGEDVYGKILVANVVLNRVNDSEFPNNVTDVVFQKVGSSYQFSPTKDGRYYSVKVSKTTKEAVNRALDGEDYSKGALYFFARKLTTEKKASWFDRTLHKVVQYGCHEFYANK